MENGKYVGRMFLTPHEDREYKKTGCYPSPPADLHEKTYYARESTEALQMFGTLDKYYAPCHFGKCVACIMHEINNYMMMVIQKHQPSPTEPINPFCVEVGPDQFRKDVCWGQLIANRPTGILGMFPILSHETMVYTQLIPDYYNTAMNRLHSPLLDADSVNNPQRTLQSFLFHRHRGQETSPILPTASSDGPVGTILTYEQLLPDGINVTPVQHPLPATHPTLVNVDF